MTTPLAKGQEVPWWMTVKTRLRNLLVNRVDLVDGPANPDSRIVLFKRNEEQTTKAEWTTEFVNDLPDSSFAVIEAGGKKDDDGKTTPRALRHLPYRDAQGKIDPPHLRNALSRLPQTKLSADMKERARKKLMAAARSAGVGGKTEKMDHDHAMTVDELIDHRRAMNEFYQLKSALMESVDSILQDRRLDEKKKAEMLVTTVNEFAAGAKGIIPRMGPSTSQVEASSDVTVLKWFCEGLDPKDVMSAARGIRAFAKLTTPEVSEGECSMEFDVTTLDEAGQKYVADLATKIAALEKRLADLKPDEEEETEDDDASADVWKSVPEPVRERIAKLEADVAAAQVQVAKAASEKRRSEFVAKASKFAHLPIKPEELGEIMDELENKVGKKAHDRLEQLVKATHEVIRSGRLFSVLGTDGGAAAEGGPEDIASRVNAMVAERIAKNAKMTRDAAIAEVMKEHPEWYESYREASYSGRGHRE